ncbi:MAG: hypothetical protein EXS47_00690 [Candidatus Zambryskibacteria bacterium]|nr:hypothetical protein [Candidatus Zambryskibacteria bacterium]
MVKRFLNILNIEISGLHQAAYLLGFFAICSQILALFRDRILAGQFGAGSTLDLYYSAFRIPDILFVSVASIISISVLIPFLIERFEKSEEAAKDFINTVFTFFFCLMIFVGLVAFFATPYLMKVLFPAFADSSRFPELVILSRILLLSPIFLGLSNLLASITQIHRRFLVYAISPVVYNIGIITGIVFLYPKMGLPGLGFGVALGALLHLGIQVPFIASQRMLPRFTFPIKWGSIKTIILISLPRTITVSANEIAKLFLISFASFLVPGSISVFSFALNLQSVPFSIIGVSYSLAAFPSLTRLFSAGEKDKFLEQMIISARHIIFWSVPVTILFIVLRAQIVRTILGAGKFNWEDTRLTAAALALFVVSLVAQNLVALFVRAYYSQGKTWTPLVINVLSAVLIVVGSFGLARLFDDNIFFRHFMESILKVSDLPGTTILMLPFGFSIGVVVNLIIHWIGFSREYKAFSPAVWRTLFEVFSASIIMGFVTYQGLAVLDKVFDINTLYGIFLQGFLAGIAGIIVGIVVLYTLGSKELSEAVDTFRKKIWRAKIVVPDAELT